MILKKDELVQWSKNGKHHTGRVLLFDGIPVYPDSYPSTNLVQHSYTGDIHAVSIFDLSPYPSSPIPEPSK